MVLRARGRMLVFLCWILAGVTFPALLMSRCWILVCKGAGLPAMLILIYGVHRCCKQMPSNETEVRRGHLRDRVGSFVAALYWFFRSPRAWLHLATITFSGIITGTVRAIVYGLQLTMGTAIVAPA